MGRLDGLNHSVGFPINNGQKRLRFSLPFQPVSRQIQLSELPIFSKCDGYPKALFKEPLADFDGHLDRRCRLSHRLFYRQTQSVVVVSGQRNVRFAD
jgi:hypothetical protein